MVNYHSLVPMFKIVQDRKPIYIHSQVSTSFARRTRLARGGAIRETRTFEKDAGKSSFIPRTTKRWKELLMDIRNSVNLKSFKQKVRLWVRNNVEI